MKTPNLVPRLPWVLACAFVLGLPPTVHASFDLGGASGRIYIAPAGIEDGLDAPRMTEMLVELWHRAVSDQRDANRPAFGSYADLAERRAAVLIDLDQNVDDPNTPDEAHRPLAVEPLTDDAALSVGVQIRW